MFFGTVLVAIGTRIYLSYPVSYPVLEAAILSLEATGIYLLTLAGSIVIYRNSPLHPLYHFPGPVLAGTSQLWLFYHYVVGHPRQVYFDLHERYGDAVRVVCFSFSS